MLKVELHLHTSVSPDCLMSFETILRACKKRGIGAVAITDHNAIEGAFDFQRVAPFPVIVGEEIRTSEGEIIGLFLKEWIPPGRSPEETIACIRSQGGLVYIPHPMVNLLPGAMRGAVLERIAAQVDIIEVFNARVTWPLYNRRAQRFAEEHGLRQSASSDAHAAWEIGHAYVEMEPFNGPEDFLSHLAQARLVRRLSNPWVHPATALTKLVKKFIGHSCSGIFALPWIGTQCAQ